MSGPFSDILLGKASIPPSPTRRHILLSFARADGQTWTEDQAESGWTDHMAEQMYGVEADICIGERANVLDEAADFFDKTTPKNVVFWLHATARAEREQVSS